MAGRADIYLLDSAKKLAKAIKKTTDMNLKLIMSAGVFAFDDAPPEKKMEYVSMAQLGDYRLSGPLANPSIDLLLQKLQNAGPEDLEQLRQIFGEEVMQSVIEALEAGVAASFASEKAKRQGKGGRRTG